MHQEGPLQRFQLVLREGYAPAGFPQQGRFVRNPDGNPEVMGGEIVDDLGGEMMHVHHQFVVPGSAEPADDMVQERLSAHGHQGFRGGVRKGFEAGSQTGGKDERLHPQSIFSMFSSRWVMVTFTSNLRARWCARCSAQ